MRRLAALCGAALALGAPLHAAQWSIDPAASAVTFTATFEGAPFSGRIGALSGTVSFDPVAPQSGRFDVAADLRSATTGSADLDEGMALPEWFDFARHPRARFVSHAVVETAPERYAARGTLTLKGVSRPVELPFSFESGPETALIRGATTLRRTDFNIGEGDWATGEAIGLEVRLEAAVTLRRSD